MESVGSVTQRLEARNDNDEKLKVYRVTKSFNLGSIYYPVGATRIWKLDDSINFGREIGERFGGDPDKIHEFMNEHFEEVFITGLIL